MQFSLIIPTINRNFELFKLLNTLQVQTYKSFEIIIVDQNNNNLLSEIDFKVKFSLDKVAVVKPEYSLCASAARNFGAKYAIGKIISFPDDDCWYNESILENVNSLFESEDADIITGGSIDPEFGKSNTVFLGTSRYITKLSEIPQAGIEYSFYIKKELFQDFNFDESISPGSKGIYQAGEITDIFFCAFKSNKKIYFSSNLVIYHPYKLESFSNLRKEFQYAAGLGYVLKKHKLFSLWVYVIFRTLGGVFNSLLLLKFKDSFIRFVRFSGRFFGFLTSL